MRYLSPASNPFLVLDGRRAARLGLLWLWIVPQVVAILIHQLQPNQDLMRLVGSMAIVSGSLQAVVLGLFGLLRGAASFARERDLQTLELLVISPMTTDEMYAAKRQAIVGPLLRQLHYCLPFTLLILIGDPVSGVLMLLCLYTVSRAVLAYCVSLGMYYSSTRPNSARATQSSVLHASLLFAISTLFPIVGWAVNPVAVVLMAWSIPDLFFLWFEWPLLLIIAAAASRGLERATTETLRRNPLLQPVPPVAPQELMHPPGIRCLYMPGPR